ncbi:MAG: DUF342 domain-containing protein [Candidatus Lindowbacteria bacterium]|nr:DUF342 domain-containing protein [Candidatus Lindowbacteria bacterium]
MNSNERFGVDDSIESELDDMLNLINEIQSPDELPSANDNFDTAAKPTQKAPLKDPVMEVTISPDQMEASLEIEMPDGPSRGISVRDIKLLLEREGIVAGIDEDAIAGVLKSARFERKAVRMVATGTPVKNGKDAEIKWMTTDPTKSGDEVVLVPHGKVLAQIKPSEKGSTGRNIFGKTLPARAGKDRVLNIGPGIKFDPRNRMYAAERARKLHYSSNTLSVRPFENAAFSVRVDRSGLKAYLTILPGKGDGTNVQLDAVLETIAQKQINCVNQVLVSSLVERATNGAEVRERVIAESDSPEIELVISRDYMEVSASIEMPKESVGPLDNEALRIMILESIEHANIVHGLDGLAVTELLGAARKEGKATKVVAHGTLPVDGNDGIVKWMIEIPEKNKSVTVRPGKMLAKYLPPTPGKPGKTVTGIQIQATPGQHQSLVAGTGVEYDKPASVWWGRANGKVVVDDNRMSIRDYEDAVFKVSVDRLCQYVQLDITPAKGDGTPVIRLDIENEITNQKIKNIDLNLIETKLQEAANGKIVRECVIGRCNPPKIEIEVGRGNMEASLYIELPKNPIKNIDPSLLEEMVREEMNRRGVISGINQDAVKKLISGAFVNEYIDGKIAQGSDATPGDDGAIQWKVPEELGDDDETVIVPSGKILASLSPSTKGNPGFNVLGESLPGGQGFTPSISYSTGVRWDENRKIWYTSNPGRLLWVQGHIAVTPYNDATCSINFDSNMLTAYLTLIPKGGDGKNLTIGDIEEEIRKSDIQQYERDTISNLLNDCNQFREVNNCEIAHGTPAQPGEDGRVGIFISSQISAKRGVPALTPVEKDEVIARIIDPIPGTPGKTVCGVEIEAPNAESITIEAGEGTRREDNQIIASETGNAIIKNDIIEIQKVLEFNKDVTSSIGEINFDGHIVIRGSVGDNVLIKARGDVYIGGSIGAATIQSGGNIEVGAGIAGRDRGKLEAKGTIRVQFVERATIESRQNIVIARNALHAHLLSVNEIDITQDRGNFVGGSAAAGNQFRARTIGSESGTATYVSVGINPFVKREIMDIDHQLMELKTAVKDVLETLREIGSLNDSQKSPMVAIKFRELTRKKVLLPHRLKQLISRRRQLEPELFPSDNPSIEISDLIQSGVKIQIEKDTTSISDPVSYVRITKDGRGIQVAPLS